MSPLATRASRRIGLIAAVAAVLASVVVPTVSAAEGLTMQAAPLIGGHVRQGTWMAIEVHLRNDGPAVTGELRMAGGVASRTRYGVAVDMPTGSDKRYVLYGQPPPFGRELDVVLVSGDKSVATTKVAYQLHDVTQPIVGVVADDAAALVAAIGQPAAGRNQGATVVVPMSAEQLPGRAAGWAPLDRLVWQDADTARLTPEQVAALRSWLASGGRLIVVGGTSGPGSLSTLPDDILPYRPDATTDVDPATLAPFLGPIPGEATALPALSGSMLGGRALVTSGDRVVAADRPYGLGRVTIVGFDPTVSWIAGSTTGRDLWQRLLPPRAAAGPAATDDSQILQAVGTVATLALPPVGGLLLLLVGYIVLIGPINYFVLKRRDRREWAWITMPVLIGVFAVSAFVYGGLLRGSDILINEVAVVRGAPGATEGQAQAYYGIFSPGRGTYQFRVGSDALLSAPINGDFFGNPDGTASALDILQGEPSTVRDLAVAIGGFRVVRAESLVAAPRLTVDLRVKDGELSGTVRNDSATTIGQAAVILGSTVARLGDIGPGQSKVVTGARIDGTGCCQPLSDRVVGQLFSGIGGAATEQTQRMSIRHAMVDQLTWDPMFGNNWALNADGAVVVGFGEEPILDVQIDDHSARRTSNVLYYVPAPIGISGTTRFRGDLMTSAVVAADAMAFTKDPWSIGFGRGTMTMAYRPIPFEGTMTPRRLILAPGFGPDASAEGVTQKVATLGPAKEQDADCATAPCPSPTPGPVAPGQPGGGPAPSSVPAPDDQPLPGKMFDGIPEIELLDVASGTWMAFPHMTNSLYEIEDGPRYVDPATGQVLVRFRNDVNDGVGFSFTLAMEADVR